MASTTAQGRKSRTLPLQTHEAPREGEAGRDEPFGRTVLEGEIVEEDGPFTSGGPRRSAQGNEGRVRRGSERARRREEAWDARRSEAGKAPVVPPAPADPSAALKAAVTAAGKSYMADFVRADLLKKGKTQEQRRAELSGIHKSYVSMMVLSCLQPLGEGINAQSVLSMVGMGTAMWMLSPNFRTQVGHFRDQMKDAVTAKIEERRESGLDKVISTAAKKGADGKPLSQRWQDRLDRAERAKRGGREAYTAQSAGMTEVALGESAYQAMRQEGADVDAILTSYKSFMGTLYEQAHEDGIDAEEIARASRVIIGLRMVEEPELAAVFGELGHGQFAKSAPREVRISGTGEIRHVWSGEFESRLGQKIEAGSFEPRLPMDAAKHQAAIAETMAGDMIALTAQGGADGLNTGVVSYAAAWGLRARPDFDALSSANTPLGERLRASSLMLASMHADGISPEEQQRIYSNAYVDAMETISARYPEVEEEWGAKFGTNWRENMRSFVGDPHSFMGAGDVNDPSPQASSAWEAGPAQPSAKYRNARINQNYIATAKTGLTGFGSDSSDYRDGGFDLGG